MQEPQLPGAESRFIDATGVNTHYYEAGSGEPLLLIHGGGAGADAFGNWRGCLHGFARHFHVYAVDMIGFGYTDKPAPDQYDYTQQGRVEHIIAVIEALDLPAVHLIGNSMGGMTSMGVAVERPALVRKLVLMGSAGVRSPISDELKAIMDYDYTTAGMLRIARGLTNPGFAIDDDLVAYRHGLSIGPETRAAYTAVMNWIRERRGLYYDDDYMRRVTQQTLIVNGKQDLVVPLSCAYRLLELIDDSTGFILPHCGHWAMIEHPDTFSRITIDFLQT